jgi:hypothetical protein
VVWKAPGHQRAEVSLDRHIDVRHEIDRAFLVDANVPARP